TTLYGSSAVATQLSSALGMSTPPAGNTTLNNLPRSLTDVNGTTYRLNLTAVTNGPRAKNYTYDAAGRLSTFTDVANPVTNSTTSVTTTTRSVTTYTYDAVGNKLSETLANTGDANSSRQTTYQYDLYNRLVLEIFDPMVVDFNQRTASGLNIYHTTAYDLVDNAIAKA